MIISFGNDAALAAWERRFLKGYPVEVLKIANKKLLQCKTRTF